MVIRSKEGASLSSCQQQQQLRCQQQQQLRPQQQPSGSNLPVKYATLLLFSSSCLVALLLLLPCDLSLQVLKCKELGRAMRIGTNHGSLSARILSYYGDTPRWVQRQEDNSGLRVQ